MSKPDIPHAEFKRSAPSLGNDGLKVLTCPRIGCLLGHPRTADGSNNVDDILPAELTKSEYLKRRKLQNKYYQNHPQLFA